MLWSPEKLTVVSTPLYTLIWLPSSFSGERDVCTLSTMSGEGGDGGGGAAGDSTFASSVIFVSGVEPQIDAFPTWPIEVSVAGSPVWTLFTLDASRTEIIVLTVTLVCEASTAPSPACCAGDAAPGARGAGPWRRAVWTGSRRPALRATVSPSYSHGEPRGVARKRAPHAALSPLMTLQVSTLATSSALESHLL